MTAITLSSSGFDATAPLARANPVAKLAASTVIAFGLLLSVDVVTAATALALELLVLPLSGLTLPGLVRRGLVVVIGAVPAGVAAVLFGVDSGAVLLQLGPLTITEGSL